MANQEPSTIALTRHQLFEKVWTTPMIRLAKDFGLSNVGLRKTCQRYNIPTPPAGYWSKKQHGKAGPVPGLPPEDDRSCDVIRFQPPAVTDDDEMTEQREPRHADVALALEREKSAPRIEVGELGPHVPKVVASTYRALSAAKPDKYGESFGRVRTSSHAGEFLNVNIGPNSIDRCMRFLSAFIRTLEARGFKLMYKDQGYDKGLRLVILGEELSFRIFEPSRRKRHVLTAEEREEKKRYPNSSGHKKWDFDPSGQLEFSVSGHGFYCPSQTWRDTNKRPLETIVKDVIIRMLWIADELKTKREDHLRAERERVDAERRRREAEERRRKEEARVRSLLEEIASWERSRRIRRYLRSVERFAMSTHGRIDPGSELDTWLKWAAGVADGADPMCSTEVPADRIDPLSETEET